MKDTAKRMKRQTIESAHVFANMIKVLYSHHINDSKFNNTSTNNMFYKYAKYLKMFFTKEDIQLANIYMKIYSTFLAIN